MKYFDIKYHKKDSLNSMMLNIELGTISEYQMIDGTIHKWTNYQNSNIRNERIDGFTREILNNQSNVKKIVTVTTFSNQRIYNTYYIKNSLLHNDISAAFKFIRMDDDRNIIDTNEAFYINGCEVNKNIITYNLRQRKLEKLGEYE